MSIRDKATELVQLSDARNELIEESDDKDYIENRLKRGVTSFRNNPITTVASLKSDISTMVVGIVFVAVGILLVSELDAALPTISNTGLSEDYETTLGHFGTGITLVGIMLIVLPAVSILRRFDVI